MASAKGNADYATVAASQTAQSLGPNGQQGDILDRVVIIPGTVSPGVVQIKDGSNTAITIFAGGANSAADLKPVTVILGVRSNVGAWQITTGANVTVVACGKFS